MLFIGFLLLFLSFCYLFVFEVFRLFCTFVLRVFSCVRDCVCACVSFLHSYCLYYLLMFIRFVMWLSLFVFVRLLFSFSFVCVVRLCVVVV